MASTTSARIPLCSALNATQSDTSTPADLAHFSPCSGKICMSGPKFPFLASTFIPLAEISSLNDLTRNCVFTCCDLSRRRVSVPFPESSPENRCSSSAQTAQVCGLMPALVHHAFSEPKNRFLLKPTRAQQKSQLLFLKRRIIYLFSSILASQKIVIRCRKVIGRVVQGEGGARK